VGELKRPSRVVVVDADNPLAEVRGEFFWREDHERAMEAARSAAYEAGYADALAAADPLRTGSSSIRVRVVRRRRWVLRACVLVVALSFLASLMASLMGSLVR
jgi:hypothetical protein